MSTRNRDLTVYEARQVGAQRLKETETVVDKLKAARQLCEPL